MSSIREIQYRIAAWADEKGWFDGGLIDSESAPSTAEVKLAKLALAHRFIDQISERVREDPEVDMGAFSESMADEIEIKSLKVRTRNDCNTVKILAKLALIHTEITEAVDAVIDYGLASFTDHSNGRGKPEGLSSELQDIIIRCMHLASELGFDCQNDMASKMYYNDSRPRKHGKHA